MSQVRDLEWGTHVFVFARPLSGDWTEVDGTFLRNSGEAEFRPCMIRGINESQRIYVCGSPYGYDPARFEIGPDVDCNLSTPSPRP